MAIQSSAPQHEQDGPGQVRPLLDEAYTKIICKEVVHVGLTHIELT